MSTTIYTLFITGGPFMWPLLLMSILAVAIVLERGIKITLFRKEINQLLEFLKTSGKTGKLFFSLEGADLFSLSEDEFDKYIEQETQLPFDRMFMNLEYLSAISAIAPLLGFIGTVSGMISSFQSIAAVNKVSVNLVAGGISEALITTGFGLIIAVICLSGEHLYRFILTSHAHKIEEAVTLAGRKNFSSKGRGEGILEA
ncbi:MAG: MotA/TolQ/ExbB proton channel family protein [Spirochaetales bacterium]|nr:MotA/TolQ/ExbB proton channel family protein [Spirochaetales bacterium]